MDSKYKMIQGVISKWSSHVFNILRRKEQCIVERGGGGGGKESEGGRKKAIEGL